MLIYYIFGAGVLLLNNLMTIGRDDTSKKVERHDTDGWQDVTMMILKHFIGRDQYVEILVWGAYWKPTKPEENGGKCIHISKTF